MDVTQKKQQNIHKNFVGSNREITGKFFDYEKAH